MPFDLHGHRGARGLRPENTLPAFEAALDLLVTTLEFDLHLTKDHHPIVCHDPELSGRLARVTAEAKVTPPSAKPRLSQLTLVETRAYIVDMNPDPFRFPQQKKDSPPAARNFAQERKLEVYGLPTLAELLAFVGAYAGDLGRQTGKTYAQRARAREVRFNMELKRVPFRPECIGDGFDGTKLGVFEARVVDVVRVAGVAERTIVQSFDHRSLKFISALEPKLTGAVLISGTAPASAASLAKEAGAAVYSPDYQFLDQAQVRAAQGGGLKVIPWTVNDPADMARLLEWGVDGLITDFPDRLIPLLQQRHLQF